MLEIPNEGSTLMTAVRSSEQLIRETAHEIIDIVAGGDENRSTFIEHLQQAVRPLLAQPDLLDLGVDRKGNHVDNSKYLYYDGQLVITLDQFPKDRAIPPHDHGVWEMLAIYRGRVHHTVFERKDDGSVPGYADLEQVDDRVLEAGDTSLVALPAEIHGFTALTDNTFSLTVVGGHYKAERYYFDPAEKTCVLRRPKALE
jgi:predicted metal-dependent enzyme (double-stranded beta helix superfamily)